MCVRGIRCDFIKEVWQYAAKSADVVPGVRLSIPYGLSESQVNADYAVESSM